MIVNKNPDSNQYSPDPKILRKVPIEEEARDKIACPERIKKDIPIEGKRIASSVQNTQEEEVRRLRELLINEKAKSQVKRNNTTEKWIIQAENTAAAEESIEEMVNRMEK